ncbi:tetratricopeptide repeat protein [Epilithonimonas sp.]|uniref:tetratricopeptide repeat protein n=1 Tax=Epilithonimonas sp. TaxID=2894511 RepID=UPI0028A23867|nr:tetratricopeptide repeat protein [Epilithonimonas sp.]
MYKSFLYFLVLILFGCAQKQEPTIDSPKKQVNPFYEKAFVFIDNDQDSAFYYFNKGKDVFIERKDSFGVGKCYVNMAIIQENTGDNFGSIETSLTALNFLNEKDISHYYSLYCNYNNLGVASTNLKNYDDARRFYDKAYLFTKDPIDKLMLANNIGIVYHDEKNYGKAITIYKKLLDSIGSKSEFYPKLLLNFSRSKWFDDKNYNPTQNYLLAEKLSENLDDEWTKDAAFAYLSAYYLNKNADSSRLYAVKMLDLAQKLSYPTDQLEALKILIKLSDGKIAQRYFDDYSRIQDSLLNAQNQAKNQFALIRFESEKSKAENLKLQKEHEAHEYQMERQKVTIISIISFIMIFGFCVFLWIKRKRENLISEANNQLQEQRLDFSKKVHDLVANGIYEVMTTIENQNDLPKEKILDKLELMYEKSRDLSYDNKALQQDFCERVFGLISSFDNEKTKIIIIGNDEDFWTNINRSSQEEFFQIIRELLVNMKKHSHASQVILRFVKVNNLKEIKYIDNGIGLAGCFVEKNGFSNMRSRLLEIDAKMEIEESESGLKLSIKL